jgi:hypothetical protein
VRTKNKGILGTRDKRTRNKGILGTRNKGEQGGTRGNKGTRGKQGTRGFKFRIPNSELLIFFCF